ncbi:MAG TPA: circadian clock protein KaiC [Phycisphaerae bacterium]|nr:circadian clock protein KaiC [Phycisphaerae bacterium]
MAKGHGGVKALEKCPTGIEGLDEVTKGGLPRGRPTLICGTAGCGKSLMGIEFLVRGAVEYGEPGVLMTFEETAEDIKKNVASLGFDLDDLIRRKKIYIDYVRVERSEIEENGEYDLEGLFVRLNYAVTQVGAKRVVLDTIETLFSGLSNPAILRAELRRLFGWLKERELTTVITGERGEGQLTRQGLEEYVSDCVILLDHRVNNQVSTRRLRVVKYRGSTHGTNEYPFLIDEDGITVMPLSSASLNHPAPTARISSGVPRLDAMLGGKGFLRGSSVLVSGTAGTGKSSLAGHFANAACARGERVLYFAFEESKAQIMRNMKSIGLDLEQHEKKGLLHFFNARPTAFGLEMHLAMIHKRIGQIKPAACVFDPVTNLLQAAGGLEEVNAMLTRLIDYLKSRAITAMFTSLTVGNNARESTDVGISSLMDTWILLRDIELNGERNRAIYILKSRGMAHSNQVREFVLTKHGIELVDVYLGAEGVLTGSARLAQEARERAERLRKAEGTEKRRRDLERRRKVLAAQIAALEAEYAAEEEEVRRMVGEEEGRARMLETDRAAMARNRRADVAAGANGGRER